MDTYVCDTHMLFWHLTSSNRLGAASKAILGRADRGDAQVVIPAIVWFELYYVNEKVGRPLDILSELRAIRDSAGYICPPLQPDEVSEFPALSAVPEMHDRMIAAVARRLGATCLTRDTDIIASGAVRCVPDDGES